MLREGLIEEFSGEDAPASEASPSGTRVMDGTTAGEFASVGIPETNL